MPPSIPNGLAVPSRATSSQTQIRQRLMRSSMLAAVMMSGGLAPVAALAQALPTGGQVVAGTAGIAGSGPNLTVTQTSDKAIIDWSSFSVGQGNAVQFNNGSGATLNRVAGGNLSSIDGLLSATGSVYLINPNGVIIGKSGVVKVGGGFVASTLDIGNAAFMGGGDLTFEGPSLASVVNLGQIGALGGDVALVAANVRNDGTVNAPNGALGLLAGDRVLMRDAAVDDGKFLVLSGGAGTSVTNTGSIAAATAELRAEGGNVYALAGNTQGLIRATGVSTRDGHIYLSTGTGSVDVEGSTLSATNNGNGGTITVTGRTISVAADATLDASGKDTGGSVTAIADMASGRLDFHGTALAKGSLTGGFVETSGHKVDFAGARIDTTGAKSGNWLVDPDDLTVDSTAASTIQTNLASTDVTLQTTSTTASGPGNSASGSGDIIVNSDITWSSNHVLTLDSYHSIQVNANLAASGSGGVVLTTNNGGSGGDYTFALGKSLSFTGSGGSLTINGNSYTLLNNMSDLTGLSGGASGHYALAKSLDASGATYTDAVVTGSFAGTLEGLGNTVSNLAINAPSGNNVGLVGLNSGTVRDIGVLNGTITTAHYTGMLVGGNSGTIKNAYATGTITSNDGVIGGLVGANYGGTISNVFADVKVSAVNGIGGLVGYFQGGSITNAYAMGSAIGSGNAVGGLVGYFDSGTVTSAFATGKAAASTNGGGLIGYSAGSVSNGYYNSTTSGQSDTGKGTAQTTTQLQGTLPSGFDSNIWGTGTGLYPYLKSFYPNGVQAISGTATDASSAAAAAAKVTLYSNGKILNPGGTSAGVNGYYYVLQSPSSFSASSALGVSEILNGDTAVSGANYKGSQTITSGNVTGLNIVGGMFHYATGASTSSAMTADAQTVFGSYYSGLQSALSGVTVQINPTVSFTLDTVLTNTGNKTIKNSSGDLTISADIAIATGKTLTIDSYHSLTITSNLTAADTAAVVLKTNDGGSGGDYSFLTGKSLSYSGTGGSLTINSQAYSLLYSLSDFQGIEFGTGYYALAKPLDLTSHPFTSQVIAEADGTFTGLGNTISGLTINGTGNDYVGLIGTNTGVVRDIGLNGGVIYGHFYSGPLIGHNDGTVLNAWASTEAHVAYRSGGLVGQNSGTISQSHATGAVTSLGDNGGGVSDMGGLVGWNDFGTISQSYATGTVTGTANTTGGLVAFNAGGTITDSFATGGVFGNLYAGGLVGFGDGTISNSYSTGYVHANTSGGGFAGHFTGTVTNSYWDTTTSGTNVGIADGISTGTPTGLTRATLQNGSLPTGFSSTIWATDTGLYPYFKSVFPTGMQSISGFTYASDGSVLPAATLAVYVNGAQVGNTTAASGADGYYYLMATPGTVTGTTKIGITETVHNAGSVSATAYTDTPTLTSGQVTGFNVTSGRLTYNTSEASYSALKTSADTTFGSSLHSSLTTALDGATLKIVAASAFSLDQAISRSGTALIQAGGNLTLASTISSTASGTAITLAADGSFINTAGAFAVSASNGRWLIYTQAHGNSTAAATGNSFGGLSGKNYYNDAFNFGTGALAATPASGNRFVTGYAPVLTVAADTKTVTYNGAAQTDTYSVTGYLTGDQSADNLTGSVTGLTASSKNAGAYNLTASGSLVSEENYTISYGSGTLTVGKAALTVAAGTDSKTYDAGTTSTGTVTVTGLQGSDTITGKSQAFDSKNAGARTLSVTGYTVNDGNSGNNYTVTTQTASGTIARAALTLAAGTDSKTYDGGTTSTGTVTATGLKGADTVTGKSQAFNSKNAGTQTISVAGYTINDGNSGNNYTVTTQTASGTIAKAALTLTAVTDSKTYDATTASTGTVGVTGLKGSDTVTGKTQAFNSKNAGTQTISVAGYTINDGNGGGNYTVTTQTASGTIAKAALTAGLTGTITKTYDTTLSATLTAGNYTLSGIKGNDTVVLNNPALGSYADGNAGTGKTVTVTGLALSGTDAGNYTLNTSASANIGSITARQLTLTADNLGKNVGATDPVLTYAITSGSLAGTDALTGGLVRAAGENPGVYDINQGSLAASANYDVTFVKGAFTVTGIALQNDPVVNPVSSSVNTASQPSIKPAPIGLTGGANDAGGSASDASGTSNGDGATDAGSAAGDGNEKATGPNVQSADQSGSTCDSEESCANTPYPTNQSISSSISFTSK